jgi:glutathione peroxidase
MELYDISLEKMDGTLEPMTKYKGKVLLVVNTASKCGYTPQLEEMQSIYKKFQNLDFEILGFPSSQFLRQEFSTNTEILNFCQSNYGVSFPIYGKTKVRGRKINDLYKYLVKNSPVRKNKRVRWNFEKFLINKNGEIINRYSSKVRPSYIKKDIETLL